MSDLGGIEKFVAVVRAGSFRAAAEHIGRTPSAVGKSVANLEKRLDTRLFNRTTRSLSLTDEGLAFYKTCAAVLASLEEAEALLSSRRLAPSGKLRVSVPNSLGRKHVVPVLLDLAASYSDLQLDISFDDRRVDLIEEGIDLAVRMGALEDVHGISGRFFFAQHSVICATPAYLASQRAPETPADISSHTCLRYGRHGQLEPWRLVNEGGDTVIAPASNSIVLGHADAIMDAALAGRGLAYLATWICQDALASGALVALPLSPPVKSLDVYLIWPTAPTLPRKLRVAIDALVASPPATYSL